MSIYDWTGNPWVDTGISIILAWFNKKKPEEISKDDLVNMKEIIQNLYIKKAWKSANFTNFVNYPTNNPSNKGKENQKLSQYLGEMINNIEPLLDTGNCMACGRRNAKYGKTRQQIPMTGSGGMRNYFSFASAGADYCDSCTFAVQCAPLSFYTCGGRMITLHSNSEKVMMQWANKCVINIHTQISTRNYEGSFNEGYKNPKNALFHITLDLILSNDEEWQDENANIRLYYFTNYIAKPAELDIYDLPSHVFRFLAYIKQPQYYHDWIKVVRRGYRKIAQTSEDEYKNNRNAVYEALLSDRSIVGYFINNRLRKAIGCWDLLKYYLKEVRQMNDARIDSIRDTSDRIANLIKSSSNGKRRLGSLERATNYYSFRNVLLKLIRDQIALEIDQPLFTFNDYVNNLFPDGAMGWRETQDLILFRIYEVLHPWLLCERLVTEVNEEEPEETLTV